MATPAIRLVISCNPCSEHLSLEYYSGADLRLRQVLSHRIQLVRLAFEAAHRTCGGKE